MIFNPNLVDSFFSNCNQIRFDYNSNEENQKFKSQVSFETSFQLFLPDQAGLDYWSDIFGFGFGRNFGFGMSFDFGLVQAFGFGRNLGS